MVLPVFAPLILTARIERVSIHLPVGKGVTVAAQDFFAQLIETDTFNA